MVRGSSTCMPQVNHLSTTECFLSFRLQKYVYTHIHMCICIYWRRTWQPTRRLAWKIPQSEELGGLHSMGSRRVRHDWATSLSLFTFMHWRRKWQPTPVFLPGESQGPGSLVGCRQWGCTVWHDWSDLAAAAAYVYTHILMYTGVCKCTYAFMCVYINIHVCMCTFICSFLCVYECVCAYKHVYTCVNILACVCVSERESKRETRQAGK